MRVARRNLESSSSPAGGAARPAHRLHPGRRCGPSCRSPSQRRRAGPVSIWREPRVPMGTRQATSFTHTPGDVHASGHGTESVGVDGHGPAGGAAGAHRRRAGGRLRRRRGHRGDDDCVPADARGQVGRRPGRRARRRRADAADDGPPVQRPRRPLCRSRKGPRHRGRAARGREPHRGHRPDRGDRAGRAHRLRLPPARRLPVCAAGPVDRHPRPGAGGGPAGGAGRRRDRAAGAPDILRHRPGPPLPAAGAVPPAQVPGRRGRGGPERRRPHSQRRARATCRRRRRRDGHDAARPDRPGRGCRRGDERADQQLGRHSHQAGAVPDVRDRRPRAARLGDAGPLLGHPRALPLRPSAARARG